MKQVKLKVLDSSLKEVLGGEFNIELDDDADILDLIIKIDASRKEAIFHEELSRIPQSIAFNVESY